MDESSRVPYNLNATFCVLLKLGTVFSYLKSKPSSVT